MKETLYWITILDGVCGFLIVAFIFTIIISIYLWITYINACIFKDNYYIKYGTHKEGVNKVYNKYQQSIKTPIISSVISFLLLLAFVFTPNTKQMLIITGVGETLEYIQTNNDIKELPDKAVKSLNKLFDDYLDENNKNK